MSYHNLILKYSKLNKLRDLTLKFDLYNNNLGFSLKDITESMKDIINLERFSIYFTSSSLK